MIRKNTYHAMAYYEKILILAILILPWFFIWQGLDFTDTGYLLTNYRQIFNDPSSVEYSYRIWLTNILGGTWMYLFGEQLGYLGFRIAGILIVYLIVLLSYLVLIPLFPRKTVLPALFLSVLFINRSEYLINYNILTSLFLAGSVYLLVKGLQKNNSLWVFTAGFMTGLNTFIRLPNALGILLALSILYWGYIKNISFYAGLKTVLQFLSGYAVSIFITMLIMKLLGYYEGYLNILTYTFEMLNVPDGHHESGKLIEVLTRHYKWVFYNIGFLPGVLFVLSLILNFSRRFGRNIIPYVISTVFSVFLVNLFWESLQSRFIVISIALAVQYIGLMLILFGDAGTHEFRLVSVISLIVLLTVPLGSNNGIYVSVYGMYLSLPIVFGCFWSVKEVKINLLFGLPGSTGQTEIGFDSNILKIIKLMGVVLVTVFSIMSAYQHTYRDTADRASMSSHVDHNLLRGVFTTRERAIVVDELLKALERYVDDGDYLLAYEQIPLVHFMTDTKPYLYNAWPMLYSPDKLKESLSRALKERPGLPVIVRARGSTEEYEWPKVRKLSRDKNLIKNREIMDDFIARYNYNPVWRNSFFEILVPGN